MIDLQIFRELDPAEVSDENMNYYREELIKMHDELSDAFAEELKKIDSDNFDPYSFFGERKVKKISKKYAKKISEVDMLVDVIDDEMDRREKYNEEQRYTGSGKYVPRYSLDPEEYLKQEQEKTARIRKSLENDDNNEENQ